MCGELKKLVFKDLRKHGKKLKTAYSLHKRVKLNHITLIEERPPEINSRTVAEHWEGEYINGTFENINERPRKTLSYKKPKGALTNLR